MNRDCQNHTHFTLTPRLLTLLADVTGDGDAQAPPLVLEELNAVFLLLRQQQPLLQSWQS